MERFVIPAWLAETTLFGLPLAGMLWALLVAAAAWLLMTAALRLGVTRARRLADRTPNRLDDVIVDVLAGTSRALVAVTAVLIGLGMLDLPDRWHARVGQLWFVTVALQLGLWLQRALRVGLAHYQSRHAQGSANPQAGAAGTLMAWGVGTLLWTVVALAILANLGVNITAFVASLGVGGIAVALAVQNILGDLFASVAIAVDKPFEVGDFIVTGSVVGSVERIGLKTTRIRALSGEQVVVSNTELLKQTINNYKRLQRRRIVFTFGVTQDTEADRLAAIPPAVRRLVEASERLQFDRAHFKGFGESSLDFEVVYIVRDADFNVYMDEQQRINLGLVRALREMGVGFARPVRVLQAPAAAAAALSAPAREAAAAARGC